MSKKKKPISSSGSPQTRTVAPSTELSPGGSQTGASGRVGFVYVMTNVAQPGLVKLGKSERHPSERVKDEDLTTSAIPTPFVVRYYAMVDDMDTVERLAHDSLADHGLGKDFFRVSPANAALTIEEVSHKIRFRETDFATPEETQQFNAALAPPSSIASDSITPPAAVPTSPSISVVDSIAAKANPQNATTNVNVSAARDEQRRRRQHEVKQREKGQRHADSARDVDQRAAPDTPRSEQDTKNVTKAVDEQPAAVTQNPTQAQQTVSDEFRPVKSRVTRSLAESSTPSKVHSPDADKEPSVNRPASTLDRARDEIRSLRDHTPDNSTEPAASNSPQRDAADRTQLYAEFQAVENDVLGTIDSANSTLGDRDSQRDASRDSDASDNTQTSRFSNTPSTTRSRGSERSSSFFRSGAQGETPTSASESTPKADAPATTDVQPSTEMQPNTEVLARESRSTTFDQSTVSQAPQALERRLETPQTPRVAESPSQSHLPSDLGDTRVTAKESLDQPDIRDTDQLLDRSNAGLSAERGVQRDASRPDTAPAHMETRSRRLPAHRQSSTGPDRLPGSLDTPTIAPSETKSSTVPGLSLPEVDGHSARTVEPTKDGFFENSQPGLTGGAVPGQIGSADASKENIESWVLRRDATQLMTRIRRLTWLWAFIGLLVGAIVGFTTFVMMTPSTFSNLLPWDALQLDALQRAIAWIGMWALVGCIVAWIVARSRFRARARAASMVLRRGRVD